MYVMLGASTRTFVLKVNPKLKPYINGVMYSA